MICIDIYDIRMKPLDIAKIEYVIMICRRNYCKIFYGEIICLFMYVQKLATQRQRGLPPKPPTPNHFFKNIGQHERQQQVLNEERKKEYNQKLTEVGSDL